MAKPNPPTLRFAGEPSPEGLIQASDIEYIGAFRVPDTGGGDVNTVNYSLGTLCYNPEHHTIYMAGFFASGHRPRLFEFEVPALSTATTVAGLNTAVARQANKQMQEQATVTHGGDLTGISYSKGFALIGGMLVAQVVFYYTGSPRPNTIYVVENPRTMDASAVRGFFNMDEGKSVVGRHAGYMGPIPAALQAELGGTYFAGGALGVSNDGGLSDGPSFVTFDPADLMALTTPGSDLPHSAPLLNYPRGNGMREKNPDYNEAAGHPYFATYNKWTELSRANTGFIPNGSRTFMAVGRQGGGGPQGWTYIAGGGPEPIDRNDWDPYFWLYDIDDLVAVKNGQMAANAPEPYAHGILPMPAAFLQSWAPEIAPGTYDPATGYLWAASKRSNGNLPLVLVWKIEKGAA